MTSAPADLNEQILMKFVKNVAREVIKVKMVKIAVLSVLQVHTRLEPAQIGVLHVRQELSVLQLGLPPKILACHVLLGAGQTSEQRRVLSAARANLRMASPVPPSVMSV